MASSAFIDRASTTCSICPGIALHPRQVRRQVGMNVDALHLHLRRNQPDTAVYDRIHIGALPVHRRRARESQKILHQLAAAPALLGDQVQALLGILLASSSLPLPAQSISGRALRT